MDVFILVLYVRTQYIYDYGGVLFGVITTPLHFKILKKMIPQITHSQKRLTIKLNLFFLVCAMLSAKGSAINQ